MDISPYLVQMRENAVQKNSESRHFPCLHVLEIYKKPRALETCKLNFVI